MGELNAELGGAIAPAMRHDVGQRIFAGVGIKAHAAVGDAAVALDMRCIGDTTMRFGSVRSASLIGENKALGIGRHMRLEMGKFKRGAAVGLRRKTVLRRLDRRSQPSSPASKWCQNGR